MLLKTPFSGYPMSPHKPFDVCQLLKTRWYMQYTYQPGAWGWLHPLLSQNPSPYRPFALASNLTVVGSLVHLFHHTKSARTPIVQVRATVFKNIQIHTVAAALKPDRMSCTYGLSFTVRSWYQRGASWNPCDRRRVKPTGTSMIQFTTRRPV